MKRALLCGLTLALLALVGCERASARRGVEEAQEKEFLVASLPNAMPISDVGGGTAGTSGTSDGLRTDPAPVPPAEPGLQTQFVSAVPRQLVQTAALEISVTDTEGAAEKIQTLASSLGGYVGHVNARREDDLLYYQVTLRVPAARFADAVAAVKELGVRIESEAAGTDDVTDQYVDIDARLRTLKATEAELQALLGEARRRRNKVEDVMAVYHELTTIRSQIEQLQGQLNTLETQVAFAKIDVSLRPDAAARPVVVETWRPLATARAAAQALVDILQGVADAAIVATIVALPMLLLVGMPVFVGARVGVRTLRRLRQRS